MHLEVWRGWHIGSDDVLTVYRHSDNVDVRCIEVYTDSDLPVGSECISPPVIPH